MSNLPSDALEVGRVMEAYGVKGGIKVQPFSKSADGLLRVKAWFCVAQNGEVKSLIVESAKWHGDVVTAILVGLTDRDAAHALRGHSIWVSSAALPITQADEYYWRDLIGCQAIAQDGGVIGLITELTDTGVHAVLHVDCGVGFEPALIPFVNEYVGQVDIAAKTVQTVWQRDWLDAVVEKAPKPVKTPKTPKTPKPAPSAISAQ